MIKVEEMESSGTAVTIRIWAPLLPKFVEYLDKKVSQYVIGVEEKGKEGNRHHHIWAVSELSFDSFRKQLQKIAKEANLPVTKKGQANAYYAVAPPKNDQYDESYPVKNGCHLSKGYTLEQIAKFVQTGKERFPEKIEVGDVLNLPVLAQQVQSQAAAVRPAKIRTMRDRFIHYLVTDIQWEKNTTITVEDYHEKTDKIMEYMTAFFENAFTIPEGTRMARNALWTFADDAVRDKIIKTNQKVMKKLIFGD